MIVLSGWYPWANISTEPPSDEYAFELGVVNRSFLFFVRQRVDDRLVYRLHSTGVFENGRYIDPVAGPFYTLEAAKAAYLILK